LSPEEAAGRTHAFIIGGENLLAEQIVFWQDFASDTMLVNEYGPTEAVVGCCVYRVPKGERGQGSVPIGYPITNAQIYLLDSRLQPVPPGVTGELHIGGVGLARGYLNRPELTAAAFIPDSFGGKAGARLYKSGDLARHLPDGNVEFLGRIDQQVKIRGFRIELGEIESVLEQHSKVRAAAVLAREDEPGDKRLVAYVVAANEQEPTDSELRRSLKEQVPDYMVPSAFVTLEALPLTPNGKVDRRALPVPDGVRPELETRYVPPQTEIEKQIAAMMQEILQVEQVGLYDNFFDLGGHSLLLLQLQSKLQTLFDRDIPIVQLFRYPTIRDLARHLSQTQVEKPALAHIEERGQKYRAALKRQRQQKRRSAIKADS
jgi:acyl carrier protein